MSRDDLIQMEGAVTRVLGGGMMEIKCDDDIVLRGTLAGRMKKYRIKVMPGDPVQLKVSPYDTSHGLIIFRLNRCTSCRYRGQGSTLSSFTVPTILPKPVSRFRVRSRFSLHVPCAGVIAVSSQTHPSLGAGRDTCNVVVSPPQ